MSISHEPSSAGDAAAQAASTLRIVLARTGEEVELLHVVQHGEAMVALVEFAGGRRKLVRLDELAQMRGRGSAGLSVYSAPASLAWH